MVKAKRKMSSVAYLSAFLALILLGLFLAAPGFFSINNIMSIFNRLSYVLIAALGMNLIILTSNIDVSTGSLISVVCLTIAAVGKTGANYFVLALVAMAVGAILSAINGLFITKLRIPAIVATLATSQLFSGILPLLVEGSIYDLPPSFTWLGFDAKLFGFIPLSILLMLVVTLAMLYLARHTRFVKKIYAIGNNPQAASYAGVNVERTVILTYALAGALFGLAGSIVATASQRVTTTMGSGLEMTFIAAVVLGGTSVSGGSGKFTGTIVGAAMLTLVAPAINYLGISSDWSDAIMGTIIITSVVASEWRSLRQSKVGSRVFAETREEGRFHEPA